MEEVDSVSLGIWWEWSKISVEIYLKAADIQNAKKRDQHCDFRQSLIRYINLNQPQVSVDANEVAIKNFAD